MPVLEVKDMKHYLLLFCIVATFSTARASFEEERLPIAIWNATNVSDKSVTLTPFLPEKNLFDGMAVIILPGGSYSWHDYEVEGTDVARWFNTYGIAAFVLKYRVQGVFSFIFHSRALFGGHKHPDMIEDVQRAIQIVREKASLFNVNPDRIGTVGFSAGGHLSMSAACFSHTDFLKACGVEHSVSLRPDFVVPVYPVVTMSHPCCHKRSRRALLGEWGKNSRVLRDSLSLEKHIPKDCPPVFLVNCIDDPVVNYYNSVLLDSALSANGVNHVYVQYKTGGHGFGTSDTLGSPESRLWKNALIDWLRKLAWE